MIWDVSLGAGEQDKYHIAEFTVPYITTVQRREIEIVEVDIAMWDVYLGAGEQDKKYKQVTYAF